MKKLFVFALVALAVWYGWKHYPELLHRVPANEVVVRNETGHALTRIRVMVGGQTLVVERLESAQEKSVPFAAVSTPGEFSVLWEYDDQVGERHWKGGGVAPSPLPERHTILIDPDGEVIYSAAKK